MRRYPFLFLYNLSSVASGTSNDPVTMTDLVSENQAYFGYVNIFGEQFIAAMQTSISQLFCLTLAHDGRRGCYPSCAARFKAVNR